MGEPGSRTSPSCQPLLPSPAGSTEWRERSGEYSLQWRDRAGFAPDFPFMPFLAPEEPQSEHCLAIGVNESLDDARGEPS